MISGLFSSQNRSHELRRIRLKGEELLTPIRRQIDLFMRRVRCTMADIACYFAKVADGHIKEKSLR